MTDYDIKVIINSAYIIGKDAIKFEHDELAALAEVANGEWSETKAKADWEVFEFENEPSIAVDPKSVEKILRCREVANAIYEQSTKYDDINYASGFEYFCLVMRRLRCLSKCAFIFED